MLHNKYLILLIIFGTFVTNLNTLMNKEKSPGQVYTPAFIVDEILNISMYDGIKILDSHIIDNSCGDGAFLAEVVRRYCTTFVLYHGSGNESLLSKNLETYIHGIEIDQSGYERCLMNLNLVVKDFNVEHIKWDILNVDAITCDCFNGKMDFVVGNPPYVRTHNLGDNNLQSLRFINGGMPDLYLAFFDIGFKMLNKDGILCYITPSSWLNSVAGREMRNYIIENKNILKLIDFEHCQVFDASTYVMISCFQNSKHGQSFDYYVYNCNHNEIEFVEELTYYDISIGENFYLSTKKELRLLNNIRTKKAKKFVSVKNGIATLADKVFIGEFPFDEHVIPIIKASTGNKSMTFFPYNENGVPVDKVVLFENKKISDYMYLNSEKILKGRDIEDVNDWHLYGRSQAVKDVYKNKIAINTYIKDINSIKFTIAPSGIAVYSGLYILTDIEFDVIEFILKSYEFIEYIKSLKNYKSGGYYTFSSKDLELFLNYYLTFLN